MNSTQIVWVYGASGAGKETFIHALLQDRQLAEQLLGTSQPCVACHESIHRIAQYPGDPVGESREGILAAVQRLAAEHPGAVILIKGQDLDLKKDRLNRLRDMLPECVHRIVFLDANLKEQYRRVQQKSWYDPLIRPSVIKHWYRWQVQQMRKLENSFAITAFLSEHHGYQPMPFPPDRM